MRLKIYSDRALLPGGIPHVILLTPFWGPNDPRTDGADVGRFDGFRNQATQFFELVARLEDADAAVLPFDWTYASGVNVSTRRMVLDAHRLAAEAERLGKPLIVFFMSDSMRAVPIRNAVILKTSLSRRKRALNEFAVPVWSVDFLAAYRNGQLSLRSKPERPLVGYCGYVDYETLAPIRLLDYAFRLLIRQINWPGANLRGLAVRALKKDRRVATNFILRRGFSGRRTAEVRSEYVENMIDSDYALVARGNGNFSFRLYEILSCGRIPLFLDSDCVLPFDDRIDWKQHCVWIAPEERGKIADRLLEFHGKLSPEAFESLQRKNRELYEQWISPVGFFSNLWRYLPVKSGDR